MFYEPKRERLSVTSDFYNNTSMNGNITNNDDIQKVNKKTASQGHQSMVEGQVVQEALHFPPREDLRLLLHSAWNWMMRNNKIINGTRKYYFMKLRQQHPGVKRRKSSSTGLAHRQRANNWKRINKRLWLPNGTPFGNITDPQAETVHKIVMIFNSSFQDHDFIKDYFSFRF